MFCKSKSVLRKTSLNSIMNTSMLQKLVRYKKKYLEILYQIYSKNTLAVSKNVVKVLIKHKAKISLLWVKNVFQFCSKYNAKQKMLFSNKQTNSHSNFKFKFLSYYRPRTYFWWDFTVFSIGPTLFWCKSMIYRDNLKNFFERMSL
jgi:hypothetical protein